MSGTVRRYHYLGLIIRAMIADAQQCRFVFRRRFVRASHDVASVFSNTRCQAKDVEKQAFSALTRGLGKGFAYKYPGALKLHVMRYLRCT